MGVAKNIQWKENENGCWICTSHAGDKDGYPRKRFGAEKVRLNRYIYEQYIGKIPDGYVVCHKCDNTACINPDHLFVGTIGDNNADCKRKGRYKNGRQKLSDDEVRAIRRITAMPVKFIAKEYGVTVEEIYRIRNGTRRKGVV